MLLHRGGAVTGRVVNEHGEPQPDLMVRLAPPSGQRERFAPIARAQTNDLGEFRIAGVPDGDYHLIAQPRPRSPFETSSRSTTALISTYYPGTSDVSAAGVVTMSGGQTVSDLQFVMQSSPAFEISGVVVDASGRPVAGAMVNAMSAAPGMFAPLGSARSGPDGSFRLSGATAGLYRLTAVLPVMGGGGSSFVALTARPGAPSPDTVEVSVDAADVGGVRLVISQQ